jgi:hypothetical protein
MKLSIDQIITMYDIILIKLFHNMTYYSMTTENVTRYTIQINL